MRGLFCAAVSSVRHEICNRSGDYIYDGVQRPVAGCQIGMPCVHCMQVHGDGDDVFWWVYVT